MTKIYAGIGSRKAPEYILKQMYQIGTQRAASGWHLHTGACHGPDQAFANGALSIGGKATLYLPWENYEKEWVVSALKKGAGIEVLHSSDEDAFEAARTYHPLGLGLSGTGLLFHARNHNILQDVVQVICWTPDGGMIGGTSQALREATDKKIDIRNLYFKKEGVETAP